MKNLLYLFSLLLVSFSFYSCTEDNPEQVKIEDGYLVSGKIYVKDNGGKALTPINIADISKFWIEEHGLEKNTEFVDFEFGKGEPTDRDEDYYMLKAKTADRLLRIASKVEMEDGKFRLTGESCTCKGCGQGNGCEVWTMCSCSRCSTDANDCEKTHTVTSESHFSPR